MLSRCFKVLVISVLTQERGSRRGRHSWAFMKRETMGADMAMERWTVGVTSEL